MHHTITWKTMEARKLSSVSRQSANSAKRGGAPRGGGAAGGRRGGVRQGAEGGCAASCGVRHPAQRGGCGAAHHPSAPCRSRPPRRAAAPPLAACAACTAPAPPAPARRRPSSVHPCLRLGVRPVSRAGALPPITHLSNPHRPARATAPLPTCVWRGLSAPHWQVGRYEFDRGLRLYDRRGQFRSAHPPITPTAAVEAVAPPPSPRPNSPPLARCRRGEARRGRVAACRRRQWAGVVAGHVGCPPPRC